MKYLKSVCLTSVAIVCSLAFAVDSSAQGWDNNGPVIVYDGRDGVGASQTFGVGEFRNDRSQLSTIRNDRASSVFVEQGYRIRLCETEAYSGGGRCEEFGPGYHNLRYDNTASYIRVSRSGASGGGWGGGSAGGRGVTVYDDRDYRGASQSFGPGRYLNEAGQLGAIRNDEASSVIVDRGYRVRFCENEGTGNGGGRCEEYNEGRYNLRLNDEASYIEIRRTGGGWGGGSGDGGWGGGTGGGNNEVVIVYSDRNQGGDEQTFGVGTYRNDQNGLGNIKNDDAGSIMVPRGCRVRICDSEGGGRGSGVCEEYGPGSRNLRYNDKMSYIRVTRSIF